MDDAALAKGADEVVRGEITNVSSQWNADHTSIVTTATVRVKGRAKGTGPEHARLTVPGGTVDGVTEWVEDEPVLVNGTEAFIFVSHGPKGNRVYGGSQGVVPVEQGRVRGSGKTKGGGVPADAYRASTWAQSPRAVPPRPPAAPAPRAVGGDRSRSSRPSRPAPRRPAPGRDHNHGHGLRDQAVAESYADVGFIVPLRRSARSRPIWASGYPYSPGRTTTTSSHGPIRGSSCGCPTGLTPRPLPRVRPRSGYLWVLTEENGASESPSVHGHVRVRPGCEWTDGPGDPYGSTPTGSGRGSRRDPERDRRLERGRQRHAVPVRLRRDDVGGRRHGWGRPEPDLRGHSRGVREQRRSSTATLQLLLGGTDLELRHRLQPGSSTGPPAPAGGRSASRRSPSTSRPLAAPCSTSTAGCPGTPRTREGDVRVRRAVRRGSEPGRPPPRRHRGDPVVLRGRSARRRHARPRPPTSRPYPGRTRCRAVSRPRTTTPAARASRTTTPSPRTSAARTGRARASTSRRATGSRTSAGSGAASGSTYTVNATAPQSVGRPAPGLAPGRGRESGRGHPRRRGPGRASSSRRRARSTPSRPSVSHAVLAPGGRDRGPARPSPSRPGQPGLARVVPAVLPVHTRRLPRSPTSAEPRLRRPRTDPGAHHRGAGHYALDRDLAAA